MRGAARPAVSPKATSGAGLKTANGNFRPY
jgi:hypothetical protein